MNKYMKKSFFVNIFSGLVLIVLAAGSLRGQGERIVKINEFLVLNETGYIDDYGKHSPWIEVFNPAYNSVNIAKMYITNDPANPKKYRIPDAGNLTIMPPRSFVVFFADNNPEHGIFHVNFIPAAKGYFAIYDSDGKTLLDEIYYPEQKVDVPYGRLTDGGSEWGFLNKSTPMSSNVTEITETSAEMFGRLDPTGIALTIISMSVVFAALILLYLVYKLIGNLNQNKYKIKVIKPAFLKGEKTQVAEEMELSGETNAAIALALSLYVAQIHDFENTTITIKKISRPYSPWSSKIYGLRNNPKYR